MSAALTDLGLVSGCLDFLERAYDQEGDDAAWLGGLVRAAWDLWGRPRWAVGLFYEASELGPFRHWNVVSVGALPQVQASAPGRPVSLPPAFLAGLREWLKEGFGAELGSARALGFEGVAEEQEVFAINGRETSGLGCFIGLAVARSSPAARPVALSQRLAAHLSTAYLCRRQLAAARGRPPAAPVSPPPPPGVDALTPREQQVVCGAALGKTSKEIAHDLGITDSTARVLLARAYARLGVRSCKELRALPVVRALQHPPESPPPGTLERPTPTS